MYIKMLPSILSELPALVDSVIPSCMWVAELLLRQGPYRLSARGAVVLIAPPTSLTVFVNSGQPVPKTLHLQALFS